MLFIEEKKKYVDVIQCLLCFFYILFWIYWEGKGGIFHFECNADYSLTKRSMPSLCLYFSLLILHFILQLYKKKKSQT